MAVAHGAPAALAEPVAEVRRSWSGMPQALGLVLGAVLVTALVTGTRAGYLATTAVLVLLAAPFARLTPDHPLGGHPTLYAVTARVTLLGSVLVLRIRSVA